MTNKLHIGALKLSEVTSSVILVIVMFLTLLASQYQADEQSNLFRSIERQINGSQNMTLTLIDAMKKANMSKNFITKDGLKCTKVNFKGLFSCLLNLASLETFFNEAKNISARAKSHIRLKINVTNRFKQNFAKSAQLKNELAKKFVKYNVTNKCAGISTTELMSSSNRTAVDWACLRNDAVSCRVVSSFIKKWLNKEYNNIEKAPTKKE